MKVRFQADADLNQIILRGSRIGFSFAVTQELWDKAGVYLMLDHPFSDA